MKKKNCSLRWKKIKIDGFSPSHHLKAKIWKNSIRRGLSKGFQQSWCDWNTGGGAFEQKQIWIEEKPGPGSRKDNFSKNTTLRGNNSIPWTLELKNIQEPKVVVESSIRV
jgi:hypothetical protein